MLPPPANDPETPTSPSSEAADEALRPETAVQTTNDDAPTSGDGGAVNKLEPEDDDDEAEEDTSSESAATATILLPLKTQSKSSNSATDATLIREFSDAFLMLPYLIIGDSSLPPNRIHR